jgi:solute carrier family 10 (sodium/bile acid cotransporter), member 7
VDQLFSLGHVPGTPKSALTWRSDPLEPGSGEQITSMSRPKFLPENFTLALIATVVAASVLPCRGATALAVDHLTVLAIALLFFLHGAKLSREAVIEAASHWRLHALVLLTTFVLFPLFGLAFRPILSPLVTPTLYAGILFLCTLPSTVQSSIAYRVGTPSGRSRCSCSCLLSADSCSSR